MSLTSEQKRLAVSIIFSSSSSSDEEDTLLHRRKKRSCWVRPYYQNRDETGAHHYIVKTLSGDCIDDPMLFRKYMRMSLFQFEELLLMVGPNISKQSYIRQPISASMRLAITLRFLATGESQQSLSIAYKCSPASVHNIVTETTEAITASLKNKVFPKLDREYFKAIATGFEEKWNFPHCIGAIDGKHVRIQAPAHSGSEFFNYKKFHSLVLLAICDYEYKFLMCDIGAAGRQSDGGVFRNSEFGKKFYSNLIDIPPPSDVAEDFKNVPYVFVADDAFALSTNMLKPYSKQNLDFVQRIFNYRLSRARRIIENAFGILNAMWRIFNTPINAKVELTESIIQACVCLHNWLRSNPADSSYMVPGLIDRYDNGTFIPGSWRNEPTILTGLNPNNANSPTAAKRNRDEFANYFVNTGAVSWQNEKI